MDTTPLYWCKYVVATDKDDNDTHTLLTPLWHSMQKCKFVLCNKNRIEQTLESKGTALYCTDRKYDIRIKHPLIKSGFRSMYKTCRTDAK